MEFLCDAALFHAAMMLNGARATAQIIPLAPEPRAWARRSRPKLAEADDPFWPDVSSQDALENPAPMNSDNRAGRVLAEIALIFATVGAFILVVGAFLPAP